MIEMTLEDAKQILCANVMVACERAGFAMPTCKMVEDALDIVLENPRIMRLPEAMSKYDPVLAEFKNCNGDTFTKWVDAVISPDLRHVTVTDLYCEEPESRRLDLGFNLYNRMFRFWTGKPTDEQRNAEPWQSV